MVENHVNYLEIFILDLFDYTKSSPGATYFDIFYQIFSLGFVKQWSKVSRRDRVPQNWSPPAGARNKKKPVKIRDFRGDVVKLTMSHNFNSKSFNKHKITIR